MDIRKLVKAVVVLSLSAGVLALQGCKQGQPEGASGGTQASSAVAPPSEAGPTAAAAPAEPTPPANTDAGQAGTGAIAADQAAPAAQGAREIQVKVTEDGWVPNQIDVKAGEPVKLVVTRVTDKTCATDLLIKNTAINVPLPLNKPVEVAYTAPAQPGKVKFGCAMDMMVWGEFNVK